MHSSYSEFPNCRNNFIIFSDLSTDPDKYVVDMEPKDSRLKVKFAIKVPNGL